ncbi:Sec-independent protein translocase protein TatB [Dyella subtropica]|uniref:Sec-independent protein translocase protein TatB n=1 Tax=Dyella subtropica TaxID=2992127 RepID=UPI002254AD25|nr:Sec-independent protein translocase protein TatB [Dyella subtropica]
MIEISFGKLVLLALIALIVLGPEKLPGAARTAGALLRRVRTGWDSVRAEVERELQVEEIKRQAREAAAHAEAAQSELDATLRKVRETGGDVMQPKPLQAPDETTAANSATPPRETPHGGA